MTTVIPLANLNILEIQLKIRFSKDNCDLGDFLTIFGVRFWDFLKRVLGITTPSRTGLRRFQKSVFFRFYVRKLTFGEILELAKPQMSP